MDAWRSSWGAADFVLIAPRGTARANPGSGESRLTGNIGTGILLSTPATEEPMTKTWIARAAGLCVLAAAFFAPVRGANAAAPTAQAESCTVVSCGGGYYCCNSCSAASACFMPDAN